MARYRQDNKTHKLIPIDEWNEEVHGRNRSAAVHGDLESFVSPVDGSVISDRAQLREHNRKHKVTNSSDFSPEFYEKAAKERAMHYNGEHTRKESFARKQEIYDIIVRAERDGN